MTCWKSASRRRARTTSSRSTAARCWRQKPRRRARGRMGASPKRCRRTGKPLDIQATATDAGLDVDVRGSGPLDAAADRRAGASRRAARSRAAHPPWRIDRAAAPPTLRMGKATVPLPPAAFLQATAEGEARAGAARACRVRRRQTRRRSVLRRRSVRAAAGRARARPRRRRRRGRAWPRSSAPPRPPPASSRSQTEHARPVPPAARRRRNSQSSTPSCSIRRARAPRRRRASWRQARCRAIVAVSCNPATFARDVQRSSLRGGYRLIGSHAGRPVPLCRPCGDRRAAGKIASPPGPDWCKFCTLGKCFRSREKTDEWARWIEQVARWRRNIICWSALV